jgi:hypothetical protein
MSAAVTAKLAAHTEVSVEPTLQPKTEAAIG